MTLGDHAPGYSLTAFCLLHPNDEQAGRDPALDIEKQQRQAWAKSIKVVAEA